MGKKLTVDVINRRLAPRGIEIIGELVNTHHNARFRCSVGHEWEAWPNAVLAGNGCAACSGNAPLTADIVNQRLARRGITLISPYITSATKSRFKCQHGHEWEARPREVMAKCGCPHCAKRVPLTPEVINERLSDRGIKIIGPYRTTTHKTDFQCQHGHQWQASPGNILNGVGCPVCKGINASERQRMSVEVVCARLAERDFTLLGDYVKNNVKTLLGCPNGHQWHGKLSDVFSGSGCPHCANPKRNDSRRVSRERVMDLVAAKGITLIGEYSRTHAKTRWRCDEGHEFDSPPSRLIFQGGCPFCAERGYKPALPGALYVLMDQEGGRVKIGISNNPKARIDDLQHRTPFPFFVLAVHNALDGQIPQLVENELHSMLAPHNAGLKGFSGASEWFHATRSVLELVSLL